MFGTFFNVAMIIGGCIIGSIFKKGIKDEYHQMLMNAIYVLHPLFYGSAF